MDDHTENMDDHPENIDDDSESRDDDSESITDQQELIQALFPPIWYIPYDTPTQVRYLGDSQREEYLGFLVDVDRDFLLDVEWNPALLERVKKGLLRPEAATDTAEDDEVVVVEDRTAEDKLLDETIEDALLNRVDFARNQLLRTALCHDYLTSDDEKKSVVRDVSYQLDESLMLLKHWGSEITLGAYANDLEYHDMAVRLGHLVGIDLPRLVVSETETRNMKIRLCHLVGIDLPGLVGSETQTHDMKVRLCRLLGIDLPRLVGSETETQNGNLLES
jgi:hypothetical protein